MLRRLCVLIALVIIGAACSSSLSREDAIQDLVDEGFGQSSAECVMDDLETAGYSPNDLVGDDLSSEVRTAVADAVSNCVSAADVTNVFDDADLDEVRRQFIDSLVDGGLVDELQAECILDGAEARGVSITQIMQSSLDGASAAEVEATIAEATVECLGG